MAAGGGGGTGAGAIEADFCGKSDTDKLPVGLAMEDDR